MSKKITHYEAYVDPGNKEALIVAYFDNNPFDFMHLPKRFQDVEAAELEIQGLVDRYGVPVDAEKIMQHFLQETT